jgi:protein-S-isoprenylcysteine O-methyltransferase Ste14
LHWRFASQTATFTLNNLDSMSQTRRSQTLKLSPLRANVEYRSSVQRPQSAVSSLTGWFGLGGLLMALWLINQYSLKGSIATPLAILLPALAMFAWEIFYIKPWHAENSAVEISERTTNATKNWPRIVTKLLAFAIALMLLACWFAFMPNYRVGYEWIFKGFLYAAVPALLLGSLYVIWVDQRLRDPHDSAWHFGRAMQTGFGLVGRGSTPPLSLAKAMQFLLGWFIKGFFFVFLLQILPNNLEFFRVQTFDPWSSLFRMVFVLTPLLFTIDIVIALIGYASTFKVLDSHIRTPNNRWIGWLAAIICYPPFVILGGFAQTDFRVGGTYWDMWLSNPNLKWVWAIAIMTTLIVYVWATVAFGIRFSNLTHRGILTHGPYRLARHPAYISKNLYWWLIYVPWINTLSNSQALLNCIILLGITITYFVRAKTEEAHLREDPAYLDYTNWFESNNLWQRLRAK